MPKHIKPTIEELDENIKKAAEEIDKMGEVLPSPSLPVPSEPPVEPSKSDTQEEIDYKKKFSESTREARLLQKRNKEMNEAIDIGNELPDPTDEEMQKEYTDWEIMGDFEKRLAKESLVNKKRFELLHKASMVSKDIEKWNMGVDKFLDNPQTLINYPDMENRGEELKAFAMEKPERRQADFQDLVASFLYTTRGVNTMKNKGAMFESGTGGAKDKETPKTDKISLEQARLYRKVDYAKYKEYMNAGKIATDDL